MLQSLLPVAQLPDNALRHDYTDVTVDVCGSTGVCNGLSGVYELCASVREGEGRGGVCERGKGRGGVCERGKGRREVCVQSMWNG